ncbi:Nif11-like leader peptide family natural product precursor [Myxococcus stipitatus]|uniref:Nif11-like leader peptide family natural product precursor n=1 Tax=Myxococcus stipitatus TaxID=83455 RepID=UPI001F385361|nr:Nif11-like leader peptide family natural product precursor [Myxococcus stipitatus]MCE9670468.1 Nif11-like leader peptide family natural product precursor [Myxococcus stipitatus]
MSAEDFARFQALVLEDVPLQQALAATKDVPAFITLARQLGAERGCHFTDAEVREEIRAARQQWLRTWL